MYQLTAQIQQFSTGLHHSLLNFKEAKSKAHATLTVQGCTLHWSHQLSLVKVDQSHSTQSGVLKIYEDMAQVNQLTKYA